MRRNRCCRGGETGCIPTTPGPGHLIGGGSPIRGLGRGTVGCGDRGLGCIRRRLNDSDWRWVDGWLLGRVFRGAVACVGRGECDGNEHDWKKEEAVHGFEGEMAGFG